MMNSLPAYRRVSSPAGRHVAPLELARIGGGGGYQHDAPLELLFSHECVTGSWSVGRPKRNRELSGERRFVRGHHQKGGHPEDARPTQTTKLPPFRQPLLAALNLAATGKQDPCHLREIPNSNHETRPAGICSNNSPNLRNHVDAPPSVWVTSPSCESGI